MDASDMIRRIQGQATLKGYNTLLQKEGQPASRYDLSDNCCGFFDISNNSFNVFPNFYPPNYSSYEFRYLVGKGLEANGCVPTNTVSITKQAPVVCQSVNYTVPLGTPP
jgi:hypothetical protein